MKNIIFAFLAVFLLISCAKENKMEDTDFDLQTRSELTPGQLASGFSQIVHGSFDPTRTFDASDAILGVETLLNYEYSNITGGYHEVFTLRDTFVVDKRNGMIDDKVVQDIYDETLRRISCHFLGIADSSRMQLYTDLDLVNENSAQIEVAVVNAVGLGSLPAYPPAWPWKFNTGDVWHVYKGDCSNPNLPVGAPEELAKRVNWNVGVTSVEYGEWYSHPTYVEYPYPEFFPVPLDPFWHELNPYDLVPNDCIMDYNLWQGWSGCPQSTYCLDFNELNFYLGNAEYDVLRFEQALGKKFINIEIKFYFSPGTSLLSHQKWYGKGNYFKRNFDAHREPKVFTDCDLNQ